MTTQLPPLPSAPASNPLPALLLGIVGGALIGARRDLSPRLRAVAALGGMTLIGVAAHAPLSDALKRAGTRRRAVSLHLSLVVPHRVETVFGFLRDFENFPRIISALREVRDHGDGRSHWCASTGDGGIIEWETVTTKYLPNRVIAWRSVVGSPVQMTGSIRFMPENGSTCLRIALDYRVLGGGVTDAIAAFTRRSRAGGIERDIRQLSASLDAAAAEATASPS